MTYKIGQRFKLWTHNFNADTYLLCRTGKGIISLINLESGVNWSNSVECYDNKNITEAEMLDLCIDANWAEIFTLLK